MQTLPGHGFGLWSNLAKAVIRVHKSEINGGHYEHLM